MANCDVNNDGLQDLIVSYTATSSDQIYVLTQANSTNSNANFTGAFYATAPLPFAVVCADLNNDGYADLVVRSMYARLKVCVV